MFNLFICTALYEPLYNKCMDKLLKNIALLKLLKVCTGILRKKSLLKIVERKKKYKKSGTLVK